MGGIIVNGRIEKNTVGQTEIEFIRNRISMQDEYMLEIEESFEGMIRGIVPLFESDVRGVEMLGRVASALFAE